MSDLEPGVVLSTSTIAAMERLSTSPHTAMTEQHRATPQQWADTEDWAAENLLCYSCLLELRARIKGADGIRQDVLDIVNELEAK
jgi:hypothetical protein